MVFCINCTAKACYGYVQIFPILVHCVAASTLVQQQTVDEEIWKLAPQKRDALGW